MKTEKTCLVTARQIRAARALLDWSQDDLADACDLSIATIRKFETGQISPRDTTLQAISFALEARGIEFHGISGVRLNDQDVELIEGVDCFVRLVDHMYDYMHGSKGEVLFMNSDPARASETEWATSERLASAGVTFRLLVGEGYELFRPPLDNIRCVPKKYFKYNLIAIFKDKVAISIYSRGLENHMGKVSVIKSASLANAMRGTFEFMWDHGLIPSRSGK